MNHDISREDLKKLIDSKSDYVLVDVREVMELHFGMIPTAKSLPLSEIEEAFELSDEEFEGYYGFPKPRKEDNLIFYCKSGGRSAQATEFALSLDYDATNFSGSINSWSEIDKNVKQY